jgi:hypothetical protein
VAGAAAPLPGDAGDTCMNPMMTVLQDLRSGASSSTFPAPQIRKPGRGTGMARGIKITDTHRTLPRSAGT